MDNKPFLLSAFGPGFTPGARELFKQENHLALYQLPSGEKAKEYTSRHLHCFTKRQPPISHLISLFVRDSSSSECHICNLMLNIAQHFLWDAVLFLCIYIKMAKPLLLSSLLL